MNNELAVIEDHLERLESVLIKQLTLLEAEAGKQDESMVRMPPDILSRLRAALGKLRAMLLDGSGNSGRLTLVSEQHDALRIRMLYLDSLLACDMPRRYVELALKALMETRRERLAPKEQSPRKRRRPEPKSLLQRVRDFLRRLFGMGSDDEPAETAGTVAEPQDEMPRLEEIYSEQELRIIYLHKLMEEDVLDLLPEDARLPPVSGGIELPKQLANFSARDFAENHFGERVQVSDGSPIARTPEELRAKLAARMASKD